MKTINEIGNTYGHLVVTEEAGSHKRYGKLWKCECICGKTTIRTGVDLRRGHFISCGCMQGVRLIRKINPNFIAHGHFLSYKNSKPAKTLGFKLTEEEFIELCKQTCHYCGSKPQQRRRAYFNRRLKENFFVMEELSGIDRKNNLQGYTKSNAVPCCSKCNHMKKNLSIEEFLEHVNRIVEFNS